MRSRAEADHAAVGALGDGEALAPDEPDAVRQVLPTDFLVPALEGELTGQDERLARIRNLKVTEETFTVDPSFDPKRYETEAFGVARGKPMTVVVRFRADQAPYVREREWHPTQRFRPLPDGRLEMTFRAGGVFEIVRWVLGWGDAAELVRPTALRAEIASVPDGAARPYRRRVRAMPGRGRVR